MKKIDVNVAADSGAATASWESSKPRPKQLLTVNGVADWLQVKPRTIYKWVHEGYIPSMKLGALIRFDPVSIAAWVKKRETPGRSSRRLQIDI